MAKNFGLLCCCIKCGRNNEVLAKVDTDKTRLSPTNLRQNAENPADLVTLADIGPHELEGNPRNKVALSPGHSLMDWIRLGNSGVDLTGVRGKLQTVTEEELTRHHVRGNAWIAIRGQVYNVAPYMDFHPGGVDELMKGAGQDGTKLFNEVHPWVNYESILQKCLVGRLVKTKAATQDDLSKAFFDVLAPPSACDRLTMTWQQTTRDVTYRVDTKSSRSHVLVRRRDNHIRILIRIGSTMTVFSFRPVADVIWPSCLTVATDTGQLAVNFKKHEEVCWSSFGEENIDHAKECCDTTEIDAFYSAEILSIAAVTHNCRLLTVQFREPISLWLPIGHDIRVRGTIKGTEVARRYTPTHVPSASVPSIPSDRLSFLIKCYPHGALTPFIFEKNVGDFIDIGGPAGDFNVCDLENIDILYIIAAGTGITPMTRLIAWSLARRNRVSTIKLLFLNRSEKDIIWKKELDELALSQPNFSVEYALSQPDADWPGVNGRLNNNHISNFIAFGDSLSNAFVCACGPVAFNGSIRRILNENCWPGGSYFFDG